MTNPVQPYTASECREFAANRWAERIQHPARLAATLVRHADLLDATPTEPTGEPSKADQTKLGADGDCLTAGLACLLGCAVEELEDVQAVYDEGAKEWSREHNFNVMEKARGLMNALLRERFRVIAIELLPPDVPRGPALLGGEGPRGHGHYVVGVDGKMVHDPHPSRAGLVGEPTDYLVLLPVGPQPLATEPTEPYCEACSVDGVTIFHMGGKRCPKLTATEPPAAVGAP